MVKQEHAIPAHPLVSSSTAGTLQNVNTVLHFLAERDRGIEGNAENEQELVDDGRGMLLLVLASALEFESSRLENRS
jgi:hypothetical protein